MVPCEMRCGLSLYTHVRAHTHTHYWQAPPGWFGKKKKRFFLERLNCRSENKLSVPGKGFVPGEALDSVEKICYPLKIDQHRWPGMDGV